MAASARRPKQENIVAEAPLAWLCYGDRPLAPAVTPAVCERSGMTDALLVRAYIEQGYACGGIVCDAPLNIVDLAPDNGERAWRVLSSLESLDQPVRYFALCPTQEAADALTTHPFLQPDSAAQRFHAYVCEDVCDLALHAHGQNPLIVLAHGVFSRQRHDLFACHYGQVLEAWLPVAPTEDGPAIDWRNRAAVPGSTADALLEQYAKTINSAAVLLPTGAMRCLEFWIAASGGRYLLLASDAGVASTARIRLGALMPAASGQGAADDQLVNFHALSLWQEAAGAAVSLVDEGPQVFCISIGDPACTAMLNGLPRLQSSCDTRTAALREMGSVALAASTALDSSQAFVLLRACDDAPQVLFALAPVLAAAAPSLADEDLPRWRSALQRACSTYFPGREDDGFLRASARIAVGLDAWGLAARLLELSIGLYGATLDDLQQLARSNEASGYASSALACLDLACEAFAEDGAPFAERDALRARLDDWQALPWYSPELAAGDLLHIEPLGHEHAAPFLYQYRDRQIGMMTRLPCFEDVTELRQWMTERRAEDMRADFAVMHAEYGFAGVVSAHWQGPSAFFHFWMGADFQGEGDGVRAARLLLCQLEALQLEQVFTAVYADNHRSIAALARLGFERLQISALPPEEGMVFFGRGLGAHQLSGAPDVERLREFCARTQSAFEFEKVTELPGERRRVEHADGTEVFA